MELEKNYKNKTVGCWPKFLEDPLHIYMMYIYNFKWQLLLLEM